MRLFTAVWPPRRILATLGRLDRPALDGLRWTPSSSWHVTLVFHGDADLGEQVAALDAAALPVEPVQARLGPKLERFGDRVLHVPVRGLDALAAAVGAQDFRGHITLARSSGARLGKLTGRAIRGSWHVGDVTLVRSHLGRGPATYEVVHRRALP